MSTIDQERTSPNDLVSTLAWEGVQVIHNSKTREMIPAEQPGVWYVPIDLQDKRARQLFEVVRRTKEAVDLLIVSAHWGPNWGYIPPPEHEPFAQALIDAGADVIFGHSGHIVRGKGNCRITSFRCTIAQSGTIWQRSGGSSSQSCCPTLG